MSMISSDNQDKIYVRIGIHKELLEKIVAYCQWAGIKKRDHFFREAARYVLDNDPTWLEHQKKDSAENQQIIGHD